MKWLKRIFLILPVLLILCIILRGTLYRYGVAYKTTGQRAGYEITNDELKEYIKENRIKKESTDVEDIIKASLALTSRTLYFSFSGVDNNPNRLMHSKTANCIGYAAFFSLVCNYHLEEYNLSEEWIAIPKVGQLSAFGVNIHNYIDNKFFKDHDFVIIENKVTKEAYAVDPSMYDYLYIEYVTLKK